MQRKWTGLIWLAMVAGLAAEDENPLAENFGFKPLDVVKVTERAGNLLAADMNHDGLTDLVIADNSQHRIELWLQKSAEKTAATSQGKPRVNELDDAVRYELHKLGVDQEIAAITLVAAT